MALWTTYAGQAAREGQIIDPRTERDSHIAEAAVRAGLLVVAGTVTTDKKLAQHPAAIPAADVDAISTALASAVTVQSLTTAVDLDGVVGIDRMVDCAKRLTVVFDADAGWDTPSGECRIDIYGEDANGDPVKDTVAKANGSGAVTLTTVQHFSKVTQVDIEACNAATGTATMGTSAASVEHGKVTSLGIAIYDRGAEPATTTGYDVDATEVFSVATDGVIAVTNETTGASAAAQGDPVYVRTTAAGADLRGQFSGVQATGVNFGRLLNATWRTATAAGSVGEIEIRR